MGYRLLGALTLLTATVAASAQEVWFAPPDNLDRGERSYNHDFPGLFDASPAWSAKTDVFVLSPKFTAQATEAQAKQVADFLTSHHIALALSTGTVQMDSAEPVPGECGFGIEGYTRPVKNQIIFAREKRFGLAPKYIAMDEPLSFGHHFRGGPKSPSKPCQFSIEDTARRVAASIAEIRKAYPDAKIVDYEAAATTLPAAQWLPDFQEWLTAYKKAGGELPDAVVFDVDWKKPWLDAVRPATELLHRSGVRAGIFLDGTGPNPTDADAIATYKQNMAAVVAAKLPLDIVVIANWTPHPANDLPESDPNSLTAILHYWQTTYEKSK
jgi:hypothetical protein